MTKKGHDVRITKALKQESWPTQQITIPTNDLNVTTVERPSAVSEKDIGSDFVIPQKLFFLQSDHILLDFLHYESSTKN